MGEMDTINNAVDLNAIFPWSSLYSILREFPDRLRVLVGVHVADEHGDGLLADEHLRSLTEMSEGVFARLVPSREW
jgi:hypothetical protein